MKRFLSLVFVVLTMMLTACGGGGGSAGSNVLAPPVTTTTTVVTAAAVSISSSLPQINADNSNSTSLVVTVLDANNAVMSGAPVSIRASTGVLQSSSGNTDANGQLALSFSSGTIDRSNRSALITATVSGISAQAVVRIVGGNLVLDNGGSSSLVTNGPTAQLTATLRDVSGNAIPNAAITFSSTDTSRLLTTATSATTNASGVATALVGGVGSGNASVVVSANGISSQSAYTIANAGTAFYFQSPSNGAVVSTGVSQNITVQAGGATSVQFVTSLGTFANNSNAQVIPVVGGLATSVLTMNSAGQATVNAIDASNVATSATLNLTASPPVASANKINLIASRTNVPLSSGTSVNSIQLTARAIFNSGGIDSSVFNVPILFTMSGGPGGGEFIRNAIVYTDAGGNAKTEFVAGTQSSTQNGVTVRAQILGSTVATGTAPSSSDAVLTIGGQALSVVFSPATVIRSSADNTYYDFDFSVIVSDANGGAVNGQLVSLSVKPYGFTVGSNACLASSTNTISFCSEDLNRNGSLDSGEDGVRNILPFDLSSLTCTGGTYYQTLNNQLTPPNAAAGTVPSTVTTGPTGIAPFTLTYLKTSARWVIVELSATVGSVGTESKYSSIFRLPASAAEATTVPCPLPPSPYTE